MVATSSLGPVPSAKIKVIGIGGGGTNAVNTMIQAKIEGVDFIAVNTDIQSLNATAAPTKIQIGKELTKGLGAGADPDVGRDAALEDRHEIHEALQGADMVFITAGMGGGTGTGGAGVVAQIARELGALTVGVVTKPFGFEGKRRRVLAEAGIDRIREQVDTLIIIPNQRLLQIATPDLSLMNAFGMVDNVLVNAVKGISDIINVPGTINVDFADVKTIMSSTGQALMGIGIATGPSRAIEAANKAISSPLLEDIDIEGATGILINISASDSISLLEANEACSIIQDAAHEDANIIFGAVIDPAMGDAMRVTVIATGFPTETAAGYKHRQPAIDERKFKRATQGASFHSTFASRTRTEPEHRAVERREPPAQVAIPREVIHEPAIQPQSDAEELALLTLESLREPEFHSPSLNDIEINQSSFDEPSVRRSNHFQFEEFSITTDTIGPRTASVAKAFAATNATVEPSVGTKALRDDFLNEAGKLGTEIDKKIDEALELAERIRKVEIGDNLEIPTFLRNSEREFRLP